MAPRRARWSAGEPLRGEPHQANLTRANLPGANLTGAYLPNNIRWDVYLAEVVPALLAAGGKALAEVVTPEVCNCHAWTNCPIATAFGVHGISQVPELYRREADLFICLFDGKALTYEVLRQACGLTAPSTQDT